LKILQTSVAAGVLGLVISGQAHAQSSDELGALIQRLQGQINVQSDKIAEQERLLADQRAALEDQKRQLQQLQAATQQALDRIASQQELMATRGAGGQAVAAPRGPGEGTQPIVVAQVTPATQGAPIAPVGEAPPEETQRVEVEALPEGSGVLTPKGSWVWENSFDYTHGSSNRLVFRGIEIVTGIQIGVIEASDADRDAISGATAFRAGLSDRIEVEARIPYLYRSDRVTTLVQREETATRSLELEGKDLGDIELSLRYQLNAGRGGAPIYIANLRVKTPTGSSPFDIPRDEFGVAAELATGSGFWAVEPSVSFIYPTDPAVLFGSIGYLAHLADDIDRVIGDVPVGKVDPGDSISMAAGFGFALNPRFSFSLGYKHAYIMPTKSELGNTVQKSESLQVGAFTFGWSFRLSEQITLSNGYEVGTTSDSPDMRVVFRLPVRFP
jgi:hypothetical protein